MNSNFNNDRQKQVMFANRLSNELEKVTLSWTNEMREWYPHAIKALDFNSCVAMRITPENYHRLFENDTHGVNMNIVMFLCNNLEERTPAQMGMTGFEWIKILDLNQKVSAHWNAVQRPYSDKVKREVDLIVVKPGRQIIKSITGEA